MQTTTPAKTLKWSMPDAMYFPHQLRDAIPSWAGSSRCLNLTSISGACSHTGEFGRRIQLQCQLQEGGKLNGTFTIHADMNLGAAKGLAATLQELIERVSRMVPTETSAAERISTGALPQKA